MRINIEKVQVPHASLIAGALDRVDYSDNYSAAFRSPRLLTPVDAAKAFFRSFPRWVVFLMRMRNAVAALFRLKTGDGDAVEADLERFTGELGQSVVGFEVFGSAPGEILMGANDRHLDFRLSFFLDGNGGNFSVSAATTVKFNGWLGVAYFLPVRPFHRIIMPVIIRRMINMHLARSGL